jgi:hypothetical protein
MLGYISSTRKKSCRQCVKAKRRCDLGYPCCKRCFAKGLACAYPNAAVREAEVVIRQRTPDLVPLPVAEAVFGPVEPPSSRPSIDPALPSPSSSSPDSTTTGQLTWPSPKARNTPPPLSASKRRHYEQTLIRRNSEIKPEIWAQSFLTEDQVLFLISRICSLVPTLVFTGHNAFVHRELYSASAPTAFDDSCTLSALYLAKTTQNTAILTRSIETKIAGLVAASKTWSLTDHLAAVQAMIIYQAIRLFDPTLNVQALAASQNRLLDSWTANLWKRSFNERIPFNSAWDAWKFYESLRRTVLVSVFLRGGWSCVIRGGLCDQIPVLAKLPLNRHDRLWGADESEFEKRRALGRKETESLVAYGEWAAEWNGGKEVEGLTDWTRMLLAACRGQDDPRLLPKMEMPKTGELAYNGLRMT